MSVNPKKNEFLTCPKCGTSSADIKNEGKLGCPYCYNHFAESLEKTLKICHDGSTKHKGKIPKCLQAFQNKTHEDIQAEIAKLKSKIEAAVKVENYEIAGMLKSKIQQLQYVLSTLI